VTTLTFTDLRQPMNPLLHAFPAVASLDEQSREMIVSSSPVTELDSGTLVFEIGQVCQRFLLVIEGSVRVHLLDPDGHEIVLYRVRPGETCVLTTAALLGSNPYAAFAVAETRTLAAGIPMNVFSSLMKRSEPFRRFVFSGHSQRIVELMQVVSDVAFTRIQVRLARCLIEREDSTGRVAMTHDAIAIELGTAREVVSRNLKHLENEGCIEMFQGYLRIRDRKKLADFATGAHV
jgi:CRP/FNR family transcriptional regulator, anaerobic regulatory protein